MSDITFSIILPAYKQENQIAILYETYLSALNTLNDSWELIFVINGQKDNSQKILEGLSKNNPNVKIHILEKGGWGRAVKYGISVAEGKFVCYTNSARTNIEDLVLMLKYAKVNDNVIIKATRIIRESFFRKFGSVLYNFENRFLFKTPIWDVNGTPKIIPRKILDAFEIVSDDDLIDAEIIAKCFKRKFMVVEIPVVSTKRISGKSTTNIGSALKMYWGLFRIKKMM
ncbi:MAG TPA: glycosyltransferase family 2 protein [Bacteroidia bacterium]|nr:glycosyltransferase family 2 protein [Bacteroidia bacterium]